MLESQMHLGVTLSFINDASRREWEPMASSVQSRLRILQKALEMGIYTWVSMEPVIIPDEALDVIRAALRCRGRFRPAHWRGLRRSSCSGRLRR